MAKTQDIKKFGKAGYYISKGKLQSIKTKKEAQNIAKNKRAKGLKARVIKRRNGRYQVFITKTGNIELKRPGVKYL